MPEELKDKEQPKKEPEAQTAAPEAQKAPEAAKSAEAKPAAKEEAKKKKERPTNCAVCNKAFKHKHWYYKNGKYFCTKRCWEKLNADLKAKAAETKAKEAENAAQAKAPENPTA